MNFNYTEADLAKQSELDAEDFLRYLKGRSLHALENFDMKEHMRYEYFIFMLAPIDDEEQLEYYNKHERHLYDD